MRTFNEILDALYKKLDIKNDTEFCQKYGIKKNTLSTWKTRNKIPFELLTEISQNENINLNWLLTGIEPVLKDNPLGQAIQKIDIPNKKISEKINEAIQSNDIEVNYYPEVYASAGYGASNTDLVPQKVKLSSFILDNFKISNTSKIDLIRVYGDSMEPTFQNGDIAIVERIDDVSQIKNGDTIIANVEGELFIKKIEKIPFKQAIILKSSNKNYDDIIIQDFDRFQVVAVVRGKMRVI